MSETKSPVRVAGGEPIDLAAMVGYQEGAIVSRILLQDRTGTLTVFAFDAGQALSEHTVPYNAFIQVLDGAARVTVGEKPSEVRAGEIILMPGGVPHQVEAPTRFKMLLTLFKAA